jgi:uncharacterized protein (DUF2141 family)
LSEINLDAVESRSQFGIYFPMMRQVSIVGLLLSCVLLLGTAASSPDATTKVTVTVTDLRNHNGQLIFGIFKSADGFPTDEHKAVNWQVRPADADSVVFTAMLPPGEYGASVLHDENSNGKMDKNFAGIPVEGYGETNNPKPALRAATYDEARFKLPPEGATLTISLQYFR